MIIPIRLLDRIKELERENQKLLREVLRLTEEREIKASMDRTLKQVAQEYLSEQEEDELSDENFLRFLGIVRPSWKEESL